MRAWERAKRSEDMGLRDYRQSVCSTWNFVRFLTRRLTQIPRQNRETRPLDAKIDQIHDIELRILELRNIWYAKKEQPASGCQQPPAQAHQARVDPDRAHGHQSV